jgi:hypothetical protein
MRRIVLLCLVLSACSSTPKTWMPTRYSAPPGVTANVWESCWETEEKRAREMLGSRYDALTAKQKRCLIMRRTGACVLDNMRLLRIHAPEAAAKCEPDVFEDFMNDAELEQCGDDEGGGNEVLDMYLYLSNSARSERKGAGGVLNRNACPAN